MLRGALLLKPYVNLHLLDKENERLGNVLEKHKSYIENLFIEKGQVRESLFHIYNNKKHNRNSDMRILDVQTSQNQSTKD